jgi:hypothetical protein
MYLIYQTGKRKRLHESDPSVTRPIFFSILVVIFGLIGLFEPIDNWTEPNILTIGFYVIIVTYVVY